MSDLDEKLQRQSDYAIISKVSLKCYIFIKATRDVGDCFSCNLKNIYSFVSKGSDLPDKSNCNRGLFSNVVNILRHVQ